MKADDQVFFYYSGHGTSGYDPKNQTVGIPLNTGALVPADVGHVAPSLLLKQLLVGSVDLRPKFLALDKKAAVFVVFDSCYSGAGVKSIADGLFTSRGEALDLFSSRSPVTRDDYNAAYETVQPPALDPDEYPYQHLVFFSASAKSEKAYEINNISIEQGLLTTVDGRPHGILSNALIRGLSGEADTNHDGQITYEELHAFVYGQSMHQQTPQMLPQTRPDLVSGVVFNTAPAMVSSSLPIQSEVAGVSVSLSPASSRLRMVMAQRPEIRIVSSGPADLAVAMSGYDYALYVQNGVRIATYPEGETDRLIARIIREPDVRRLRNWEFPQQSFNVSLAASPADRAAYGVDERLVFMMTPERDSFLLLLNIDVTGSVTPLYSTAEGRPSAAGHSQSVETCIGQPTGTEYMKLFASDKPFKGIDDLLGRTFTPDQAAFADLMKALKGASSKSAQASRLMYSSDRELPGGQRCHAHN